jgi:hypothetical protein
MKVTYWIARFNIRGYIFKYTRETILEIVFIPLRTAVDNDSALDKETTSYNDI